ncbi:MULTISPECIES: AMP-binding protein [unclassified Cryobacterium]|uniref:AMP-binding protein n=1 Tax=unclassified Cryobacterium TaxID=2649013 RepID=UPI00106C1138|nr:MULTISPECIES: AMP-binding protein [unclassified Cryobacterium]TFC56107.1 acetate--CoA ligase [Cryobacterium sp. TMB3-1-2]TFC69659.1 acetate--CoA ligase [Cryobacterium sp. TMB3-15]TFC78025.1 acetate--CoA ligase [Cryobacterium sp. TMB3-10]TFD39549.1 acetate--CoA ligase [Cryobacterium sp. TMB3-12]
MTAGSNASDPAPARPPLDTDSASFVVRSTLVDYGQVYAEFSWDRVRQVLSGLPDGRGVNIAHEAVDRHAAGALAGHDALRFVRIDGTTHPLSYAELAEQTGRFASVLQRLGIERADRVFSLCGRIPELFVAALGTLKNGSVFCPMFSGFDPEQGRQRLKRGSGRALVTTRELYRETVAPVRAELPELVQVLLIDADGEPDPGTVDLVALMRDAPPYGDIVAMQSEDMAMLHFTSGTTGPPKGVVHVHDAVASLYVAGLYALGLHPKDVYWSTADPGWVSGNSHGVITPLVHGATVLIVEGEPDAERTYSVLADQRVTVWYTTPSVLRMLMAAGPALAAAHDLRALRHVASGGEPLDAEVFAWAQETFGRPVHDTWRQTETGGIMLANFPGSPIRPGALGRPLPGVQAAVLLTDADGRFVRGDDGGVVLVTEPGAIGELAFRADWPSMFRGYLRDDARYRRRFVGGWYLTGDLVRRDADGYYWFIGRGADPAEPAPGQGGSGRAPNPRR